MLGIVVKLSCYQHTQWWKAATIFWPSPLSLSKSPKMSHSLFFLQLWKVDLPKSLFLVTFYISWHHQVVSLRHKTKCIWFCVLIPAETLQDVRVPTEVKTEPGGGVAGGVEHRRDGRRHALSRQQQVQLPCCHLRTRTRHRLTFPRGLVCLCALTLTASAQNSHSLSPFLSFSISVALPNSVNNLVPYSQIWVVLSASVVFVILSLEYEFYFLFCRRRSYLWDYSIVSL